MVVALRSIFAQQPLLAAVRPLLDERLKNGQQLEIVRALEGIDDVYKEQILRLLVTLADRQQIEVDSEVWEEYYPLKSPSAISRLKALSEEERTIHFNLINGKSVKTTEDRSILVQAGGTGHRTWESSLTITEYLCTHPNEFSDLDTVIELGAGTGLVSLALATLFNPKKVYATDGSHQVVAKLRQTVELNGLEHKIEPLVLDWENPVDLEKLPRNSAIFAGDILYGMKSSYVPILNLLKNLEPARIILCNPIRNRESYEFFKTLCSERGYKIRTLEKLQAVSAEETDYMFIVSVPPIPVELIELSIN